MSGLGFDNKVFLIELTDGSRVVLRRGREPSVPAWGRASFLTSHAVPSPCLLAANSQASLFAYVEGEPLIQLLEDHRCEEEVWGAVGRAYRAVHRVRFPSALCGVVGPETVLLEPCDPVAELRNRLRRAEPVLAELVPAVVRMLPKLRAVIAAAADRLRVAETSLLHPDAYLANIIVSAEGATLVDWDNPRVGDPFAEVAALDEHVFLTTGHGLRPRSSPGTAILPLNPIPASTA